MTHLLHYTLTTMQNHGVLSCIGLDVPQNENEKLILSFLSKNRHFKGYICPLYSETAVEEIEEDGSAIVEFKTSSTNAWDIAVSIFEKCGYPVLISRNKKTFGTIIADSELDVPITNTKPFFWKTLRKQMSESESESESEDEAEEEVAEEIAEEVAEEIAEEVAEEVAEEAVEEEVAEEEVAEEEEKSKPIKRRLRDSERQTPSDFHTKFRQWPKPVLMKVSKRVGSITYADDVRVSKNQILKELSEHCAKQTRAGVTLDLTRPK